MSVGFRNIFRWAWPGTIAKNSPVKQVPGILVFYPLRLFTRHYAFVRFMDARGEVRRGFSVNLSP